MTISSRVPTVFLIVLLCLGGAACGSCPPADLDGDCFVGFEDLRILAQHWLDLECTAGDCEADLDQVPGVDGRDLAVLAANWGQEGSLSLVINEFMAKNDSTIQDPEDSGGGWDDWIEIHNFGLDAIDVGGMHLTDNLSNPTKWRIPANEPAITTIAAGGYLIVWADGDTNEGILHASFSLSAAGEDVGLADDNGDLIDGVSYGTLQGDQSYGRLPNGTGSWQILPGATPGSANTAEPVPVAINEIMYHPAHPEDQAEDVSEEYIELYNFGGQTVDVSGWRFTDGIDYTIGPGAVIEAGKYLVVAADVNAFEAAYGPVSQIVGGWTGKLSNGGERITLVDAGGVTVDTVKYYDEGEWAQRLLGPVHYYHRGWEWSNAHDGAGGSLELIDARAANDYGQNWSASRVLDPNDPNDAGHGSPGRANTVMASGIAPIISKVEHRPLIPADDEPVIVSAEVTEDRGAELTLRYRIDRSEYESEDVYPEYEPNDFNSVPMHDDGVHGDGAAGDGVYGAAVPAHENSTVIEFFVEARGSSGLVRTWPPPSMVDGEYRQVTNALYRVDSSFDPLTWIPGSQPFYYVVLTNAEKQRIIDIGDPFGGEANSDAQMNATFISVDGIDMKCRYRVGMRNRGHGSRDNPPNNYRINFVHDRPWKGVTAINLNTKYTYLQLAGALTFAMSGQTVPYATAVQVRVNGENLAASDSYATQGSYVQLQVMDEDFAADRFGRNPEGNIYKCMRYGRQADLSYRGTDADSYRDTYFKQTNAAADDWSDLIGLTWTLSESSDAEYIEAVNSDANVEQWLRFFAMNALLDNSETTLASGNGDDYYVYFGVEDPRAVLIQHDLDSIFGFNRSSPTQGIFRATGVDTIDRFLTHPLFVPEYYRHLREFVGTTFSETQVQGLLTQFLSDFVPQGITDGMLDFTAERNEHVLSLIPSELTIESQLPRSRGYYYTQSTTADLTGTADAVATRSVTVNGEIAQWDPISARWERSSAASGEVDVLVATGSKWKYNDEYTDLGPYWYFSVNDSDWPEGDAELGYGDEAETTIGYIDTDPYTPGEQKNITTYFTHRFEVANPSAYQSLALLIQRDDGAVVYLNGTEIARTNMDEGPVDYTTPASANVASTQETTFYGGRAFPGDDDFTRIDPALLNAGTNILAVELHQVDWDSVDISFDLEMTGLRPGDSDVDLLPGVNRILVQTFDGPEGSGRKLQRGHVDIWYDDGDVAEIGGTLAASTILGPTSGPWLVTEDLVVPTGQTLTVRAGTTVFFGQDAKLSVNGRIAAEGTKYRRIRFAGDPETSATWGGIDITGSEDNRLSYCDVEYASSDSESIRLTNARALLDNVTFTGTTGTVLSILDSSAVVQNCTFPDTESQTVSGRRMLSSEPYLVFENNVFGVCTGIKQDVVDFSTSGAGVRPVFTGNVFLGGGDDALDLDGTSAYIEGNVFMNFHRNFDPSGGESYAVTTGYDAASSSNHTIVRNIFFNCDNAVLVKDRSWVDFENNTVVNCLTSGISFDEPQEAGIDPGIGAKVAGCIFRGTPLPLANFVVNDPQWATTDISVDNCIIAPQWHQFGQGNTEADPLFVDPNGDFRLKPSSPAIGAGPCEIDMGAYVSGRAAVCGEPVGKTHRTDASITVSGPGITHYKYSVNNPNGPWSSETEVSTPIHLSGLSNGGSYKVYVLGRNAVGLWQETPTVSKTWTVDTAHSKLIINEVLAHTHGTAPDLIELYYDGSGPIDISGMSLTDDPALPRKYIFSSASLNSPVLNPGDYLVLYGDTNIAVKNHTGFGLTAEGEGLYLYDSPARGGKLLDEVEFGHQINDYSIGRIGPDARWKLNEPTFGEQNKAAALGDPSGLRINEWLTNGRLLFADDFIELYNPHPQPVDMSGLYLTDDPAARPDNHRIAQLSFIPDNGFSVFTANDSNDAGSVSFALSSDNEMIALLDEDLQVIDQVIYGPQTTDVSQGRAPDGSEHLQFFELPTSRVSNPWTEVTSTDITLVPENAAKAALVPSEDIGSDWRTLVNFDEAGWAHGSGEPGGVGYDHNSRYAQFITLDMRAQMDTVNASCYVRIPFTVDGAPSDLDELILRIRYDDGFVAYLNGAELDRRNFTGEPDWQSDADFGHSDTAAEVFEYIDVSGHIDKLVAGQNMLAIHGMNNSPTSGDFLISAELVGVSKETSGEFSFYDDLAVLENLRITEIMYHDAAGSEYDYIELQNIGDSTIDISGVRFMEGIVFEFPPMTLGPGQYTVVVADEASFKSRYGSFINIAGRYTGGLGNAGEELVLTLAWPLQAAVMRFEYSDKWYARTDGGGRSLTIVDPISHPLSWNDPSAYTAAYPTPGAP